MWIELPTDGLSHEWFCRGVTKNSLTNYYIYDMKMTNDIFQFV
jgi:hypothetical protein